MAKFSQAEIAACDAELDEYPDEPFGDERRWQCSQWGCMWLRCLDSLKERAGWVRIQPRR